jgi:hypothetical protein
MLPVMARMQGPALVISPLVAAFFVGTGTLAVAAARAGCPGSLSAAEAE